MMTTTTTIIIMIALLNNNNNSDFDFHSLNNYCLQVTYLKSYYIFLRFYNFLLCYSNYIIYNCEFSKVLRVSIALISVVTYLS